MFYALPARWVSPTPSAAATNGPYNATSALFTAVHEAEMK
jgi:hypothetical protein